MRVGREGFTLIELMVVMVIIGILASISVPALKGLGQANRSAAAHRQILDDLAFARLRAINDRAPVYMVFVPPQIAQAFTRPGTQVATPRGQAERSQLTNLFTSQFAAYALIAERTVGDQPGRHTRRYLTEWKHLPDGVLFAPYKFGANRPNDPNEYQRTFAMQVPSSVPLLPFPNSSSELFALPYIGFDGAGRLISRRDEIVTLAKGSVFAARSPNGLVNIARAVDWQLNPQVNAAAPPQSQTNNYQFVRVNWLTGRARVELPEFK